MELHRRTCDRARRSRDARFDGRFFIAITSTRIYCRPICPSRAAKDEHVRYFASAAAAEVAGYRPCLRCRPEASPGTPAWLGTGALVSRALRLINDGALDDDTVDRLADRLGITARHLRRLFLQHLGATPRDVALTRRVHFAKKLLDETMLPFDRVAEAAGFGSVRRFNSQIRSTFARTPTQLRRLARQRNGAETECYRFRLAYRPPYDWDAVLAQLAARATPGIEHIDAGRYRRTVALDGHDGTIEVGRADGHDALALEVRFPDPCALLSIVERVRRMFDLGADPSAIGDHLRPDPLLRRALEHHPGIRSPRAWDGFELAVGAIAGPTGAGRIASSFGTPASDHGAAWLFPEPSRLASAPIERTGVTGARADTIRALAGRVVDGTITLSDHADPDATIDALAAVPGLDAGTASYIAMCALGEPDAFPDADPALRRLTGDRTARDLLRRSQAWRPWRAYAAVLLWQQRADSIATYRAS